MTGDLCGVLPPPHSKIVCIFIYPSQPFQTNKTSTSTNKSSLSTPKQFKVSPAKLKVAPKPPQNQPKTGQSQPDPAQKWACWIETHHIINENGIANLISPELTLIFPKVDLKLPQNFPRTSPDICTVQMLFLCGGLRRESWRPMHQRYQSTGREGCE